MEFYTKTLPTFIVNIYIAGRDEVIRPLLAKYCLDNKICFSVDNLDFPYAGGEQHGFIIGIINYPRFPREESELLEIAITLTKYLIEETHQISATVVGPKETTYISRDPD